MLANQFITDRYDHNIIIVVYSKHRMRNISIVVTCIAYSHASQLLSRASHTRMHPNCCHVHRMLHNYCHVHRIRMHINCCHVHRIRFRPCTLLARALFPRTMRFRNCLVSREQRANCSRSIEQNKLVIQRTWTRFTIYRKNLRSDSGPPSCMNELNA